MSRLHPTITTPPNLASRGLPACRSNNDCSRMPWVTLSWLLPLLLCFTLLYATQTLATDNESLQQALEQKITEMTGNDSDVQVQVSDGIVTLSGFLQDASLVAKIEAEVKATAGVTNVVSDLSVE